MPDFNTLLATLKARGIHWEVVGLDQAVGQDLALKIQAPRGAMDAELQAQIKAYKSELIAEGRPRTPQRARAFQERLWLLQQLEPHAARYHEATYLHWQGPAPDLQALTRAFQQIHNRHDALRTGFVRKEGLLYRVWNRPSAHLCSLSLNPEPVAFIRQPFDLAAGSLFRLAWYPDTQRLLLVFHHLIADAASAPLLLQDLKRVLAGETVLPCVSPEPVEPEPIVVDTAADTAAPAADPPPRVFIDDLPRLAHRGSTVPDGAERTVYELPVAVKQRLMQGSARAGVTAFNSLLSAWQCFLQQYWQLKTPYVATPITQRHRYGAFQPVDSLMHTFLLSPPTEATFAAVLQRQQQELYGAFETFDLSAALRGLQLPAELPFFPLLGVVIQPQFAPQPLNDETTLCPLPLPWLPAKFALLLTWHQGPEGHPDTLELAWPEGWYDAEVLQHVLAHFVYVWEQLLLDPQQALATLPLMPPETLEHYARAQQPLGLPAAVTACATVPATVPATLHHCVERVAAQRPEALALQGPHAASLSYGELNARANQRARRLQGAGVKPGDGVLVEMAVTPELLVTLLAVLKAGAYYIPLQPDTPPRRRSHILSQAQPVCILDDAWAADRSGEAQASDLNVDLPLAEDVLAYQIFTSGSTGLPKPVPITHGQICRLFPALTPHMDFAAHEVWLLFHSIAFDFSVWEVWGAFYSGAVLTLMPAEQAYQPQAVWALIQHYGVTQLSQTPSAFQAMSQALPAALTPETLSLKRVILSGEKLTLGQLKPWWQRMGDAVELVNAYGITETTVFVTWHVLGSAERRAAQTPGALWPGHDSPIGQPLCDLGIELYDAAGRPVPDGVPGEIRVVGAGVSTPYGPVYASGDWALRWQGQYYYLQRRDRQVQVRGVRVECGEVEAAMVQLPEISQAYVCAWEQGLAAVVAADVSAETAADALWQQESRWKQALRQYVTAAMVPDRIWVWPAADSGQNFPVTANGKQDTEALNAFLARQRVADAHSGPASPVASAASTVSAEGHLARILPVFQRVLQRQDIPLNASFFDLGAHSLRLLDLQHELETVVGFALDPVILFRYPTLGQFLAYLDALDTLECETEATTALTPLAVDSTQAEMAPNAPIAVIGMGLRLPGADSPESYWSLLQSGRSGLSTWTPEDLRAAGESPERLADPCYVPVSGWIPDADVFDAAHFGLSAREALWMDPQQRLMLTLAHETLEQAGYTDRQRPQAVGVFASAGISRYLLETLLPTVQQSPSVDRSPMQLLIANDKDYLPTRIAHSLNLTGPALAVQSACSSSLAAVHLACQSLRQGECNLALAGGVNLDSRPRGYVYQEGGIYAKDGVCRPFDASATGIVGGSGGGWVLLKPLAAAQADGDRIYAVIEGSMITNDGADKVGYLAPGVAGQVRAVAGALQRAGRRPEDIGYIEAHGTGTRLGDPIEVAALKQVWQAAGTSDTATAGTARTARTALGSVKANIGHLDAAAGIASLIKVVLMLHHQQWVPTPHVQQLNPALGLDEHSSFFVNTQTQPWQGAPGAGVSSLGVGGTNVHVVCAPAPASFSTASVSPSPAVSAAEPVLLPLVLPDASALERAFPRWLAALPEAPSSEVSLADWAHTLWQRQQRWPRGLRLPVVARNTTEARQAWQQLAQRSQPVPTEARPAAVQSAAAPLPVVFVCPGLGSQSLESLQRFYAQSPVFAQHFDTCVALLRTLAAEDDRIAVDLGQWRQWQPEDLLAPQTMQISIFVMGWCLAQAWQALGVYPQYIVGHSFGECLAVTLAGQISLREALRWVALRGYAFAQWQAQLPEPYGVLAVGAAPESLELAAWPTLALATQNLDNRCTLSGPLRDLQAFARTFAQDFAKTFTQTHPEQGHAGLTRLLPIPHGVHTAALHTGGLSDGLRAATAHLPDPPLWEASSAAGFQCPWVWSAVHQGPWPASLEGQNPSWRDSWLTQTQQFLDFRPAVAAIRALPQAVILELSGEPQLTSLFTGDGRRGLLHKTPQSWLELVGKAWGLGAPVQLAQVLPAQGKPALLPPTPLAQTVYRLPTPGAGTPPEVTEVRTEALPEAVPLQYTAWRPVPALTLRRWQQRPALAVQDVDVRQPFEATSITAPVLRVQVPDLHTLAEALDYVEACRQWVLGLGSLRSQQRVSTWLWQVPAFSGGEGTESMNLQPFQSLVQAFLQTLSQTVNQNLAQASAGVSVCLCEHEAGAAPEALPPLDAKMPFQHLRWAQQRWWQPTTEALSAADLQAPLFLATPLREGGVYLITGASGGMATVLRQYLQQQYRARVVCLSRQPAPEDLPLDVLWLQGDVTQAQDVEHALELAYAQWGGLHGILHTAGQSHEAALAETTPEMLATAIAPKVLGLQHLTRALQKQQHLERPLPDWVVACSALDLASGPALPWVMAPWAYQASNRWLDAWCVAQQRLWPLVQWQSLRWGPWQETGMAFRLKDRLPAALQQAYQRYLDLGLTNAEAGPRFAQALALGLPGLELQALTPHSLERLWGTATAPHAAMATLPAEALPVAVLDLWQRYLGQAPTPSQRFSDLGGDSMAALQLKAAIEQELGLSVPLALLLQDLPFAAFVQALSPSDTSASEADRTEAAIPDVLVPLNEVPSGSRRAEALFFVHPISGTVFPFQHLAQALSRPLVGIQSVGLLHETATGQHTPHTDIEVMAQVYCQAIEAAGYPAPYAIGGWSFGALVAFAMARHWQQRGVAVSELILLDMVPPDPQQFRAEVLQAHFEADLARVWPEGAAQDAAQTLSPAQFAFKQRLEGIFQAHVQATQSFVPSPLSVPARLLRAQAGLAEASTTTSTDALLQAWHPYLADCTLHEIPGDHYTCLAPEFVKHWASHLAYTPSVSRSPDLLSTDLKELSDHD